MAVFEYGDIKIDVDEDGFRVLQLKKQNTKKWKLVTKSTLDFVGQILKSVAR